MIGSGRQTWEYEPSVITTALEDLFKIAPLGTPQSLDFLIARLALEMCSFLIRVAIPGLLPTPERSEIRVPQVPTTHLPAFGQSRDRKAGRGQLSIPQACFMTAVRFFWRLTILVLANAGCQTNPHNKGG